MQELTKELGHECLKMGVPTNRIVEWAMTKNYVTVLAFDPFGDLITSHIARDHTSLVMAFIVNNEHLYPITDEAFKNKYSHTKHIDL